MITFTATDPKNRFGELLEMVHRAPVDLRLRGTRSPSSITLLTTRH